MFFSIIIPVYNASAYIHQCLDSVFSQSFQDFEVIAVDDGSNDESLKICEDYCKENDNFTVLGKRNGGASSARNVGLSKMRGDYLILLDSDDFWISDHVLEDIHNLLVESNADVLYATAIRYFPQKELYLPHLVTCRRENVVFQQKGKALKALIKGNGLHVGIPRYIVKRDLIQRINLRFTEGRTAEDLLWSLRILIEAESLDIYTTPYYVYRKRVDSISNIATMKQLDDLHYAISSCLEFAETVNNENYYKYLMGFIAYQLCSYIFLVAKSENNVALHYKYIKELIRVLSYGKHPRVLLINICQKMLGLNFTMKLLRLRS